MDKGLVASVVIGVDVGGTNTDAVVVARQIGQAVVLGAVKEPTSSDVTTGVENAIFSALKQAYNDGFKVNVGQVNIGTTHFINAAVQGKDLAKVGVIRLCGSVSQVLPPFSDFPEFMKNIICGSVHLVEGGYRYDGRLINDINEKEIIDVIRILKSHKTTNIVICGIFSTVRNEQELKVRELIEREYPEASFTLSHEIGHIGLLERENAAILNECLKPLCKKTIDGFQSALKELGLKCPLFLTQNDGTVITAKEAKRHPIYTFASGPTNSMRGAAYLSQLKDALVVDIGGTTTDVGMLINGFPREASTHVKVGGVKTNFRMPDVLSIGLGGGSYVVPKYENECIKSVSVGPLSAGYNLQQEALIFTQNKDTSNLTASDVAVAAGLACLGNRSAVDDLDKTMVILAIDKIHHMIEEAIDKMKFSKEELPVVLVGGGSMLVDTSRNMKGSKRLIVPEHFGVANAIGAALCQVSGRIDHVCNLLDLVDLDVMNQKVAEAVNAVTDDPDGKEVESAKEKAQTPFCVDATERAVKQACSKAVDAAVNAGANRASVIIKEKDYSAIAYVPGQVIHIKITAIGDLDDWNKSGTLELESWSQCSSREATTDHKDTMPQTKQVTTSTGNNLLAITGDKSFHPTDPYIDPSTGEWILNRWDVECIVVGAGIYGCGGGGSTHTGRLRCLRALHQGKVMRVVTPEFLFQNIDTDCDKVVSIGFMGAPLVLYEQLMSGLEIPSAIRGLQDAYNVGGYKEGKLWNEECVEVKNGNMYVDDYHPLPDGDSANVKYINIIALMSAEIGGCNGVEAMLVAADMGLPTIDADGMGRAFPELQMFCPYMYGVQPYPAVLADDKGRRALMINAPSPQHLEHYFRDTCVDMGCSGGLVLGALNKQEVLQMTITHSVSRAWKVGNAVLRARLAKRSPIQAILDVENAKHIITGKIQDVQRQTSAGFNKGHLVIEGLGDFVGMYMLIEFQNENLVVLPVGGDGRTVVGEALACVPDLIVVIDADTAEPIHTEEVTYGLRVAVVIIASHALLRSEAALRFVGPQAFNYPDTVKFRPFADAKITVPIPPTQKM